MRCSFFAWVPLVLCSFASADIAILQPDPVLIYQSGDLVHRYDCPRYTTFSKYTAQELRRICAGHLGSITTSQFGAGIDSRSYHLYISHDILSDDVVAKIRSEIRRIEEFQQGGGEMKELDKNLLRDLTRKLRKHEEAVRDRPIFQQVRATLLQWVGDPSIKKVVTLADEYEYLIVRDIKIGALSSVSCGMSGTIEERIQDCSIYGVLGDRAPRRYVQRLFFHRYKYGDGIFLDPDPENLSTPEKPWVFPDLPQSSILISDQSRGLSAGAMVPWGILEWYEKRLGVRWRSLMPIEKEYPLEEYAYTTSVARPNRVATNRMSKKGSTDFVQLSLVNGIINVSLITENGKNVRQLNRLSMANFNPNPSRYERYDQPYFQIKIDSMSRWDGQDDGAPGAFRPKRSTYSTLRELLYGENIEVPVSKFDEIVQVIERIRIPK